jgi:hypothetical protein
LFSREYDEARSRFRDRLQKAGGRLQILELAARGPSGSNLSIDIGWLGDQTAQQVLLHSCGIHGVEAFAGSAIQLELLETTPPIPPKTALIFVHILNPFGMAWLRRANENNVDLNRNFVMDEQYSGVAAHYASMDAFLNPKSPPEADLFLVQAALLVLRYGMTALTQATAGGQYEYPQGLFFGGKSLQEGPQKYYAFIRQALASATRVLVIDVHTGLGPFGQDSLMVERQDYQYLRSMFGSRVIIAEPKHGPGYRIRGGHQQLFSAVATDKDVRFVTQEFGTYSPIKVLRALREENRWHHYGGGAIDHPSKRALREIFCPQSEGWRESVLARGREVVEKALEGL